jgi:hypothetical protein
LQLVFLSGSLAAANMPLSLVQVQYLTHLLIECFVVLWESLGKVFMYRGFGKAEVFGCAANGGTGFYDIYGQRAGSFLDGICHIIPSLHMSAENRL